MDGSRYDYMESKFAEKTGLCYMNTKSIIVYIKNIKQDISINILKDTETSFHISNNELI